MFVRVLALTSALSFLPRVPLCAQSSTPAQAPAAAPAGHVLDRIAIVGASLSDGYQADPGWKGAFLASLKHSGQVVAQETNTAFFFDPGKNGPAQIDAALAEKPTLVLAADFLFWFGYGSLDETRHQIVSEDARVALLEKGLEQLDRVPCPLVVGDFPDMSSAVGVILAEVQMPEKETLAKLNARLAEWAKAKKNVVVLPLARWVADIQAGKTIQVDGKDYPPEVTTRWMQADKMHPTPEGLAALAVLTHGELAARKLEVPADFVAEPAQVLERMKPAVPAEASGTPRKGK